MTKHTQTLFDKCFKDKQGKVVLAQAPNWFIVGWFISKLVGYLDLPSQYLDVFAFLETAFLFTWASLELTSGTNYLRRALGFVVLVAIVLSKFRG